MRIAARVFLFETWEREAYPCFADVRQTKDFEWL
jgi:hypothetical protein